MLVHQRVIPFNRQQITHKFHEIRDVCHLGRILLEDWDALLVLQPFNQQKNHGLIIRLYCNHPEIGIFMYIYMCICIFSKDLWNCVIALQ